jgi:hypothetical protein
MKLTICWGIELVPSEWFQASHPVRLEQREPFAIADLIDKNRNQPILTFLVKTDLAKNGIELPFLQLLNHTTTGWIGTAPMYGFGKYLN